ncbi:hypothetical protein H7K24_06380 [Mycobacterium fragae]|uniref:NUMOD4 domain-containing protein n=1 Tax=Mycobacterium fragae TaxID=1260918 RepID=A0A1X1V319_9MYCO|nr:NUMOD4 domain-containing protein [Mycobacterium fragae]MCV7399776.1 hypothetical protein [Mycobacterium fragae]ORV63460.1 hypothetical protein AWC06_08970 [Mycobacterium fragae]
MTEHESWLPVPGFEGWYEVSDRGRVRGCHRVIIRRNGVRYTVQPRVLRLTCHHGRLTVFLARGRRGQYGSFYVDKLVESVFGDRAA